MYFLIYGSAVWPIFCGDAASLLKGSQRAVKSTIRQVNKYQKEQGVCLYGEWKYKVHLK